MSYCSKSDLASFICRFLSTKRVVDTMSSLIASCPEKSDSTYPLLESLQLSPMLKPSRSDLYSRCETSILNSSIMVPQPTFDVDSPVLWTSFVVLLILNVNGWKAMIWGSLIPVFYKTSVLVVLC